MEHAHPHHPEGGEQRYETHEGHGTQPEPIFEQLSEEQRIQRGIADARREGRVIGDGTAALIAWQLTWQVEAGQGSALRAFASSGALDDRLERELLESVQDVPPARDSWIDALLAYAEGRNEDRGAREGWAEVARDDTGQNAEAAESTMSPEQETSPRPRIYVRCLAAHTGGILHGCWIDADQDEETLRHEVETMLNASPVPGAEEYAIHDHEGFTGYPLGEHENLAFVSRLAQGIAEHGPAFAAYADWIGRGDEQLVRFGDHLEGIYPSREAWAEEIAEEIFEWSRWCEAIPELLRAHVRLDLTDLALSLEQHRHVADGDGEIYVFNPDA